MKESSAKGISNEETHGETTERDNDRVIKAYTSEYYITTAALAVTVCIVTLCSSTVKPHSSNSPAPAPAPPPPCAMPCRDDADA